MYIFTSRGVLNPAKGEPGEKTARYRYTTPPPPCPFKRHLQNTLGQTIGTEHVMSEATRDGCRPAPPRTSPFIPPTIYDDKTTQNTRYPTRKDTQLHVAVGTLAGQRNGRKYN